MDCICFPYCLLKTRAGLDYYRLVLIKKLLFLLLYLTPLSLLTKNDTIKWDLEECIRYATENNIEIKQKISWNRVFLNKYISNINSFSNIKYLNFILATNKTIKCFYNHLKLKSNYSFYINHNVIYSIWQVNNIG